MNNVNLVIDGMGCGGCIKTVRKALDGLPGVAIESVMVGTASVRLDPSRASAASVVEALARAGYPAREEAVVTAQKRGAGGEGGHCGINP